MLPVFSIPTATALASVLSPLIFIFLLECSKTCQIMVLSWTWSLSSPRFILQSLSLDPSVLLLPPASHPTVSHIKLPAVPGTVHAESHFGMPFFSFTAPCSHLPCKYLLIFQSQLNLPILCKPSSVMAPTLTLGGTDHFFGGTPSPHIYCQCHFASLGL